MTQDDIMVSVAPSNGRPQRVVIAEHVTGGEWRNNINTDSATSRRRFIDDVADRFSANADELAWMDTEITTMADDADARADDESDDVDDGPQESQATLLVRLASVAELFHNPNSEAFARFPVGENDDRHCEVSRIRSKPFRQWLARRFYEATERAPSGQALQDAIGVLEGNAVFGGECRDVHIRVADHDSRIYIDLTNESWQVVEVTADGWRIIDESPVMFRRAKAMSSLPMPKRGGNIDELRRFVNVTDEEWAMVKAWLVEALRPNKPFPVLAVSGEQGSAKTTLVRMLRSLIDPNTAPVRSEPRDPRDLMIAANNGHVVAFDNLSSVRGWLSDCLCRLATGGGFSTRTLYENDEETIFDSMRPVVINGIEEPATRSDLVDRSIMLSLPTISEADRRSEAELWRDFEDARPRIFGALLDAVVGALKRVDAVRLERLPRMADFALWATAAEESLGLQPGEFLAAYTGNRDAANDLAIEASPVGKWLVAFVDDVGTWSGTATDLLAELDSRADDKTKRLKTWPAIGRTLSGVVKRLAPNLRKAGIDVEFLRVGKGRTRLIMLTRRPEEGCDSSSASSASSATDQNSGNTHDPADASGRKRTQGGRKADANDIASSAKTVPFPEENGTADAADAKSYRCSPDQDWGEV